MSSPRTKRFAAKIYSGRTGKDEVDLESLMDAPLPGNNLGFIASSFAQPANKGASEFDEIIEGGIAAKKSPLNFRRVSELEDTGTIFDSHRKYTQKSSYFPDDVSTTSDDPGWAISLPESKITEGAKQSDFLPELEGYTSSMSFPLTRTVLWERRPLSTPIIVPSACLVPTLWVSREALLALGYQMKLKKTSTNQSSDSPDAFLIGKIMFPSRGQSNTTDSEGEYSKNSASTSPMVCIDTMDPGIIAMGGKRIPQVPNPRDDEVVVSIRYNKNLNASNNNEFMKNTVNSNNATLGNACGLWNLECTSRWSNEVIHLSALLQIPSLSLSFTVIPPLPLLTSSGLATFLLDGKAASEKRLNDSTSVSSGYLTMNTGRRIVPLLRKKTMSSEYPLVGVWVRLPVSKAHLHSTIRNPTAATLQNLLTDPLVWSSSVNYLYDDEFVRKRVAPEEDTFLMAIFPSKPTANGEEMLPLFLEVQRRHYSNFKNDVSIVYMMNCSMDASYDSRSKLFEQTDTMVQCQFELSNCVQDDADPPLAPFNNTVPSYANLDNICTPQLDKRGNSHNTPSMKQRGDILCGPTAIPQPVNLLPVAENTEDDIKRRNDDLIVREQVRHGILKTQRLVKRDRRAHLPRDRTQPVLAGNDNVDIDQGLWDQKLCSDDDMDEPTPTPWKSPPEPTKPSFERKTERGSSEILQTKFDVCHPYSSMDRYNYQVIIQQQVQLQSLRSEIQMLKELIEKCGMVGGQSEANEQNTSTKLSLKKPISDNKSPMHLDAGISDDPAPTENGLFTASGQVDEDSLYVPISESSDILSMHSANNLSFRSAAPPHLRDQRNPNQLRDQVMLEEVEEGAPGNRLKVPANVDCISSGKISSKLNLKLSPENIKIDYPDHSRSWASKTRDEDGIEIDSLANRAHALDSEYDGPSVTMHADDFSLLTQTCLKKYGLLDTIDGVAKIRTQWNRLDASTSISLEPKSLTTSRNSILSHENTFGDMEVSANKMLSGVRILPKFK